MGDVHSAALEGFSKEAAAYARGRPGYPDTLTAWLRDALGLGTGRLAVDLGAGTGKFTPLLRSTGARIVAVEPVDAMREELERRFPDVPARAGSAQAIPLENGRADAVICAQAFHWFATEEALAEIHRVLAPGGRLGLVWNVRDESVGWVRDLTDLMAPYEGTTPRFHTGRWRRLFPNRWFSDVEETVFAHQQSGDPGEVILDRTLSVSFIAALPPAEKSLLEARVRGLIAAHPDLKDRAQVSFPYRTRAYRCVRQ
jgi:SAM-dependent methyltransferase